MRNVSAQDQDAVVSAFRATIEACIARNQDELDIAVRRRNRRLAALTAEQARLFELVATIGPRVDHIRAHARDAWPGRCELTERGSSIPWSGAIPGRDEPGPRPRADSSGRSRS